MVRHLAAKYDLDIDIIDMNSGNMNNNALMQSVNMAAGILLFEDIDNVDAAIGVKKDLEKDARKVTLDGLLNALDGVQRGASKRIIIATTNYPEKLMPSLRRRGRLGLSFEITYPSDAVLTRLVHHHMPPASATDVVGQVREVEGRLGLRAPTAALTDIFAKAGIRMRLPGVAGGHRGSQDASLRVAGGEPAANEAAEVAAAVAQVEEVLAEVASTNKKVFQTIGELLDFLGLAKELTDGDEKAEDEKKKPCTYAEAFERAACVETKLCKGLSDGQLKDELRITKIGHRMKLLDQFRFL